MKEKEEDEERNENICPQTENRQRTKSNSKTEATLILCGLSGEGADISRYRVTTLYGTQL